MKIPSYSTANLLWITLGAAFIAAFLASPSMPRFIVSWVGLSVVAAYVADSHGKSPVGWGVSFGVLWPAVLIGGVVLWTVIARPIVQGQLYDEDGPIVFFAIMTVIFFFASVAGIIGGAIIGMLVYYERHVEGRNRQQ